jgi:hypothetical protein
MIDILHLREMKEKVKDLHWDSASEEAKEKELNIIKTH